MFIILWTIPREAYPYHCCNIKISNVAENVVTHTHTENDYCNPLAHAHQGLIINTTRLHVHIATYLLLVATPALVSVQSQANVQSKLDSVSRNISDLGDVAREPSRLDHKIHHAHAGELKKAGYVHLSRINFAV